MAATTTPTIHLIDSGGVMLRTRNHTSAIAYADRLARQEDRP